MEKDIGSIDVYEFLTTPLQTTDSQESHHVLYYSGENKDYRNGETSRYHRVQHLAIHAWLILYGLNHFEKPVSTSYAQAQQIFTELKLMLQLKHSHTYCHLMLDKHKEDKEYKYRFEDKDILKNNKKFYEIANQLVLEAEKEQEHDFINYKTVWTSRIKKKKS